MKIPERIKVGGKSYTVNTVNRLALGCDYSAEILYSDLQINITPQAQAKMEADFLHELVHAMLDHMGKKEHDEREVDGLAQALHMVLTDNPGLFGEQPKTE